MVETQIYPEVVHIGRIIRELRTSAINLTPETTLETRIEEGIGGGAPITSKTLSVWGTKTAIIAAIGTGSESAREELRECGIELVLEEYHVPMDTTITWDMGEKGKSLTYDARCSRMLNQEHIRRNSPYILNSKISVMSTLGGFDISVLEETARQFKAASDKGVVTALDLGGYIKNPEYMAIFQELFLPGLRWVFGNEKEIYWAAKREGENIESPDKIREFMTPERAVEFANRILGINNKLELVNVHYGEGGTILVRRGKYHHEMPSFRPPVKNNSGPGNVQNAGIIDCFLKGKDDAYAAKFANAASGLYVGGMGYPKLGQIESVMKGNFPI